MPCAAHSARRRGPAGRRWRRPGAAARQPTCARGCRWWASRHWSSPGSTTASCARPPRARWRGARRRRGTSRSGRRARAVPVAPAAVRRAAHGVPAWLSRTTPSASTARYARLLRARQRALRVRRVPAGARGRGAAGAARCVRLRARGGARSGRRHRARDARAAAAATARALVVALDICPPACCARRGGTSACGGASSACAPMRCACRCRTRAWTWCSAASCCSGASRSMRRSREVRRVLRPDGFFAFSTFGPDTLQRAARAPGPQADDLQPRQSLHRRARSGRRAGARGLKRAGARCRSHARSSYPDAFDADARAEGDRGAQRDRRDAPRTLVGRARLRRMQRAYEALRREAALPATFEVIYGAAGAPPDARPMPAVARARRASHPDRSGGGRP